MTTTEAPAFTAPTTATASPPIAPEVEDTSFLTVIRVLLLIQGGIGLTSLLEVSIAGFGFGVPLFFLMALNLTFAVLTLYLAKRIPRHGRKARRTVMWLQYGWLFAATVDTMLSLFMIQRLLEPVPILTRIVVPLALIRMLRSPRSRLLFNVPPSRRHRRKARKQARLAEASA
ncbi:MAG: hypothetical protein HKN91_03605 [Acidimicrobiia bacterium]|nr:hypothetical protein [Acidimicrobiia bacterium]